MCNYRTPIKNESNHSCLLEVFKISIPSKHQKQNKWNQHYGYMESRWETCKSLAFLVEIGELIIRKKVGKILKNNYNQTGHKMIDNKLSQQEHLRQKYSKSFWKHPHKENLNTSQLLDHIPIKPTDKTKKGKRRILQTNHSYGITWKM